MKTFNLFFSLFVISFLLSCEKDSSIDRIKITKDMPGDFIIEMQIDNNHEFYFITNQIDFTVDQPALCSSAPMRTFLSRRESETSKYEILDDNFSLGLKMLFDSNNRLWLMGGNTIHLKQGSTFKKVLDLTSEQTFLNFFTLDNDDNIWAGGYTNGLYKISKDLKVTFFNSENSILPTSNITAVHVDSKNNIWVAMDDQGIVKIDDDEWVWYNSTNSNVTQQRIWSLTTDKDDNLWIGTGFGNSSVSLMKFDGNIWQAVTPMDDDSKAVDGAVRKLFSDGSKLYVVTEQTKGGAFYKNQLLTYDGTNWDKEDALPEDDVITDFVLDEFRGAVWVTTLNKGIYKLKN